MYRVEQINRYKSCDDIEGFKKRAKSLIVVVSTPPEPKYFNFTEQVRIYTSDQPFNIKPIVFPGKRFETFVTIYAAYLYDSVMLYANALDRLLKGKQQELKKNISANYLPNLPEEMIKEIASNGTEIIAEIIRQKKYLSITGAEIVIDNNGDSEGNFSVLVLKPEQFSVKESNFSCNFHMVPIATFQGSGSGDSLPVSYEHAEYFIKFYNFVSTSRNTNSTIISELIGRVQLFHKTSLSVASTMNFACKMTVTCDQWSLPSYWVSFSFAPLW